MLNRRPRTLKQLDQRLPVEYIELFPFGTHKDERVIEVVKIDPNYIVWWNRTITKFPIEPSIVKNAVKNYKHLVRGDWWEYPESHWDGPSDD